MSPCEEIISAFHDAAWTGPSPQTVEAAGSALEAGRVVFLPTLAFAIRPEEARLFTPAILGSSKNASYDPKNGRLGGTTATGADADLLRGFIARYDTRLHVDSFPATPSGGRRILRVFANVNPEGRARSWRVSGDFEATATRFAPSLRAPLPGSGHLLALLRVTKSPRTPYDALMLQLHDRMKRDEAFQRDAPQCAFDFPAGSTWMAFTDEVGHAAMAGQYQLEQTFLLPVEAMEHPERSPLRVLERLMNRMLVNG